MKIHIYIYILIALLLAACANTRDPVPVALVQEGDGEMDCAQLEIEYKSNTEIATAKIEKNNADDGRDIALGIFIWPGLADFKNADGIEGNALLDRNVRFLKIAESKGCDTSMYPPQPVRYD